jgi:hypothetical protein
VAWFDVELTKQDESISMPPPVCISPQILFTTDVRVTMHDNIVAANAGYSHFHASVKWYIPFPQTMVIRLSRRLNHCLSIIRQHRNVTATHSIGSLSGAVQARSMYVTTSSMRTAMFVNYCRAVGILKLLARLPKPFKTHRYK